MDVFCTLTGLRDDASLRVTPLAVGGDPAK
jgi:hypothetical protein